METLLNRVKRFQAVLKLGPDARHFAFSVLARRAQSIDDFRLIHSLIFELEIPDRSDLDRENTARDFLARAPHILDLLA